MRALFFRLFLILLLSIGLISCGSQGESVIQDFNNSSGGYLPPESPPYRSWDNSGGSENESSMDDLPEPLPPVAESCGSALTCSMQDRINAVRAAYNRPALVADSACQRAAQAHAEDMARNDYFSHTGLNGSTPTSRLRRYGGGVAAENIALGPKDVGVVVDMWMGSQGHAANILGNYRRTGIGAAFSSRGTFWVQCFTD